MAQISIYEHTEFPAALNWQAVSFMRVVWPSIFSGANRLGKETYPAYRHPLHFAVVEDEVLVSYAALIRIDLEHQGSWYRVYGFGNVFTYPSFRGEGFGRQIVTTATQYIHSSPADVAILFCQPSLERFYATSGWEALPQVTTLIGPKDNPTVDSDLRMMLFVSAKGRQGRADFVHQPLYVGDPW